MPTSVVGRDAELASLHDFVERVQSESAALVLEGEAGMGKTTLWRAAVDHAEGLGLTVLQAQPVESETTLSYAGIGDLLDPVLDRVLEPLPAAQRRALERALVLGDEEDTPLDPRAVRVALMNALRLLAEEQAVLVAIDDSQWLDYASSAVLAYGVRRYRAERVGLLLSRRSGLESGLLSELLRSPAGERFIRLQVGPLDPDALHVVISNHLETTLPRPLLAEVQQASGGNPFYAIEIVRMLQRAGFSIEAGRPLPVPDSLHDLVDERLSALPAESGRFLLAAAAHAHPTVAITEAASGVSAARGLAPAVDAGIVALDGQRIRFTHPLLAAAVVDGADRSERADVHARLAELLEDQEARAWQLAACRDVPDEATADVLVDASLHARARGAPRPAALLLDRAAELTPPSLGDEAVKRAVDAAFLHFEAGDTRRAEAKLRDLIAPLTAGAVRAKALVVLARIRLYEAPAEARELFLQVIEEAGDDRLTLALAHEGVSASSVWTFERLDEALQHGGIALDLATQLDDHALLGDVLMVRVGVETLLGSASTAATAEHALSLQSDAADARVLDQPLLSLAECWIWTDAHDDAHVALTTLLARAEELGDESARPWLLFLLGEAELARGDLRAGLDRAREGHVAAVQTGLPLFGNRALALESLASAQLGRSDETRTIAESLAVGSDRFLALTRAAALGHLALSQGSPHDAIRHLLGEVDFVRTEGVVEPGAMRLVVDLIEARLDAGQVDDAVEVLEWYEKNARRLDRISALANCARCRGLVAGRAGDLVSAFTAFEEALAFHEQVRLPLDHGRTLLGLGAAQRRAKRRREARATLGEALGVFEEIGAALWAERARAELKRISGRASTPGALTPAEARIAALVCEGKTNREVAAALFVSDRTVEGHLARIFGKLGIRRRSELAGALQTRGIDVSNTGDSPVSAESSAP
jgi:DNA-binding CsgD family transcriptional regulator